MSKASGAEPPRLASRDDPAGRLLREAERAFQSQLSPELAWKRFQSRRHRRWLLRFSVVAAAMAAAAVFTRDRLAARGSIEPTMLVAEQVSVPQPSSSAPARAAILDRRISPATPPTQRARVSVHSAILPARSGSAPQPVVPTTDAT